MVTPKKRSSITDSSRRRGAGNRVPTKEDFDWLGIPIFDYYANHPDEAAIFRATMQDFQRLSERDRQVYSARLG